MTAKVFNVFANLETEFLEAKKSLKDVDESIKKITGREPNLAAKGVKGQTNGRNRVALPFGNSFSTAISQIEDQSDEPLRKRRFFGGSAFSRLRGDQRDIAYDDYEEPVRKPTVQSSVVATTRSAKPRTQALEEQKNDKKSLARNKRMFGMILGTLQKFQNEESTRKDTQTQKRVEIEKKLDAKAEQERTALRKERRELFLVRREKEAQIRRIEHKMQRVEIHQEWERSHQHLSNYIQTKTKPNLFYLPAKHTPETEKRLQETKDKYRLIVAEKRAKVQKELSEIDELYKKEEQTLLDEDMEEMETHESDTKQNSDETKPLAQIESQSETLESNNNSNNIVISDDNNINVLNE
ncbi:unnamed protein product, partial [Oppiella nova]